MIGLVETHKGMGRIFQYNVKFAGGGEWHHFVAMGIKKEDIMEHKLGGGQMLAYREDNNIRMLIEHFEEQEVLQIKKVWG